MTHTTTDAAEAPVLPVIQADRNAAIRLLEAGGLDQTAKEIRIGEGDHFPIVQAFARHRLATANVSSRAGEWEERRVAVGKALASYRESSWDDYEWQDMPSHVRDGFLEQADLALNALATAEAASGAVVTAATATEDQLRRIQLLADVELHLKSCRIFLTSREKMHPCGVELHDELLAKVTAAIEQEGRNG